MARLPFTHSASKRHAGSTFAVQSPPALAFQPVIFFPPTKTGTAPGATSGGSAEKTGVKHESLTASLAITETLTNNVKLTSSATAQSDLVSLITPQLTIDEKGTRTCLRGIIAAPAALYVRTGGENNKVYPSVNLLGNAEVLERAPSVLAARGFHPGPLEAFRRRLETGRLPADDLIDLYEQERSIPAVLRHLATLIPAKLVGAKPIGLVTG